MKPFLVALVKHSEISAHAGFQAHAGPLQLVLSSREEPRTPSAPLRANTGADVERPPLPTASSGDLDAWAGSKTANDQDLPSTTTASAADPPASVQLQGPPSATQPVKSTFNAEFQGGGAPTSAVSAAAFGSFSTVADSTGARLATDSGDGHFVEDRGKDASTQQGQFRPQAIKSIFADKWAGNGASRSSPRPDDESTHR